MLTRHAARLRRQIFFSSDHGDFGGDYHLVEKWPGAFDDVLTHVPFVVPGPFLNHFSAAVSLTAVSLLICTAALTRNPIAAPH